MDEWREDQGVPFARLTADGGDFCCQCGQGWPCGCDAPERLCGVCGGDELDCCCDAFSYVDDAGMGDWPTNYHLPGPTCPG